MAPPWWSGSAWNGGVLGRGDPGALRPVEGSSTPVQLRLEEEIDEDVQRLAEPMLARAKEELERLAPELGLRQDVLIVEDEKDTGELLAAFLERRGHSCRVARSVSDATRMAEESDPDVVLLDLVLPDGDGWQVVDALRHRGGETRIVAVTGWTDGPSRERAAREKLDAYFLKPANLREVLRVVEGD